jgi:DNA-3-methyladenine glycosylase II
VTHMTVMLDHPAWLTDDNGRARRAIRSSGTVWSVVCTPNEDGAGHTVSMTGGDGETATAPVIDVLDPDAIDGNEVITGPLRADGTVARLRNPDLWDALATSIVRQVIRAGQARKLYREFCQAHGEPAETGVGPAWLFPTPETVLSLSDREFEILGLAFKTKPLRAAAEAYLKFGAEWNDLPSTDLVVAVQQVPRIGPWSAGASVADITNQFDLYPFADLAVRTWARRIAPSIEWPKDEPEFRALWHGMAGKQVSEWTLLTLAWGVRHANDGVAFCSVRGG